MAQRASMVIFTVMIAGALGGWAGAQSTVSASVPERVGAYAPPSGVVHAVFESQPVTGVVRVGPGTGLGSAAPATQRRRFPEGMTRAQMRAWFAKHRPVPTEATNPPKPAPLPPPFPTLGPAFRAVEQTAMGTEPAPRLVTSFDGLGYGFQGLHPAPARRRRAFGALDLSLAVGPTQVVEIINSQLAVFNKQGKVLYGAVPTNTIFDGFGGRCEHENNGDAVVRYDQLAHRWLFVMPIFSRPQGQPHGDFGMCYAVSTSANALGTYNRYEYKRPYFPDYPRPAVWPNGYYVPTSSGDGVIQKMDCIADRARMLKGEPAAEQCVLIDGASFLVNADVDGPTPPPAGQANILMANGGTQLKDIFESSVMYWFKVHVDWKNYKKTYISRGHQIAVAPFHFLCNGQLSNCVPQRLAPPSAGASPRASLPSASPDRGRPAYLDAQGDKIMQRLVYRNWDGHQSILAEDSVDTAAHIGGVRWYEFRLNDKGDPVVYQQGTYAPDAHYRWMASMDMDKFGDIAIGYSYGGPDTYPGQRVAARQPGDPLGKLTTQEAVLATGGASQTGSNRWEDYATMTMDPSDDCTFWYVGDYLKPGAPASTTKIGAFRMPACR